MVPSEHKMGRRNKRRGAVSQKQVPLLFLVIQRLQSLYVKQIVTQFEEKFNYRNRHEIPRIKKIVINRGLGQSGQNSKLFEAV